MLALEMKLSSCGCWLDESIICDIAFMPSIIDLSIAIRISIVPEPSLFNTMFS